MDFLGKKDGFILRTLFLILTTSTFLMSNSAGAEEFPPIGQFQLQDQYDGFLMRYTVANTSNKNRDIWVHLRPANEPTNRKCEHIFNVRAGFTVNIVYRCHQRSNGQVFLDARYASYYPNHAAVAKRIHIPQ